MKNRFLLATLILLLYNGSLILHAQVPYNKRPEFMKGNNIWTFGDLEGMNFSSGAKLQDSSMILGEGAASACDPHTGKLLFYTNGVNVWDKNHDLMPNGSGLLGPQNLQDVCVVPFINDPNKYYVFVVYGFHIMDMGGGPSQIPPKGDLTYSIVDMTLNNGLGDVIPASLNTSIGSDQPDTFATGIIAIPGENCDVWLMTHAFGKSVFKAYHITKNGIDKTPVDSRAGTLDLNGFGVCNWYCYTSGSYVHSAMSISPDRKLITVSSGDMLASIYGQDHPQMNGNYICKFDAATGKVSNAIPIGDHTMAIGEAAFSPDNSKLYLQRVIIDKNEIIGGIIYKNYGQIVQYDVSKMDSLSIASSAVILADTLMPEGSELGSSIWGSFKLFNDTIYVRPECYTITSINKPNLSGKACDFTLGKAVEERTVSLHSELIYNWPDTLRNLALDTSFCSSFPENFVLKPALNIGGYSYSWSNNSSDTVLRIQKEGTYWVKYTDGCHYKVDTFRLLLHKTDPPVITIDRRILSTTQTYKQYQWLRNDQPIAGATQKNYTVLENGTYRVRVRDENGCTSLSEVYPVNNVTGINDLEELGQLITIYPNPSEGILYIQAPGNMHLKLVSPDGRLLLEQENLGQLSITHLPTGMYFLNIYDRYNHLIRVTKIQKK